MYFYTLFKPKHCFLIALSLYLQIAGAATPVTGIWVDTLEAQKRTGYTVEVQNSLISLIIYSYADNVATTNPTWYIMTAPLIESSRMIRDAENQSVRAVSEARGVDIITVYNNQIGSQGNVISGNADIYVTDRETISIHFRDFNAHKQNKITIKKYWFHGGFSMEAKRLAAVGVWQYAFDMNIGNQQLQNQFVVKYLNPLSSQNLSIYENKDKNVLMGNVVGDTRSRYRVSKVLGTEYDYTVIFDTFNNVVYHFKELGGGAEFSLGEAAIVVNNPTGVPNTYPYRGMAVRRTDTNVSTNKTTGRSKEHDARILSAIKSIQ